MTISVAPHLEKKKNSGRSFDKAWWDSPTRERGDASKATSDRWFNQHEGRYTEYSALMQQYSMAPVGNSPGDYESAGRHSEFVRLSSMRAIVDTVVARYAKEQPRPVINTEKGRYRHRRYARQIQKALTGLFEQTKMYTQSPLAFRDACLFGLGFLKVCIHPKTLDISVERVHPGDVAWDTVDAFHGQPHELAHRVRMPRSVVARLFPDKRAKLRDVDQAQGVNQYSQVTSDLVDVVEMWKLPSYPGAGDGVRSLTCSGIELEWEEWKFDFFPLVPIHYEHSFRGFSGEGLGAMLLGLQYSLNMDIESQEDSVRRASKVRVWVKDGADVAITQLEEDEDAAIYTYGTEKPTFEVAQALGSDAVEYTRWKIGQAYDLAGVSQLSASGQKPTGLDAAVAMREQQDIESLRFMRQQRAYEQLIVDVTNVILNFMHTYWAGKGKKVKSPGKGFIETIDFDAVDLTRDQYEITVTPASMLPLTTGAKLQTVQELMSMQFISQAQAMALMGLPDIEAETSLATAAQDDLDSTLDGFLFDDPTPEEMSSDTIASQMKLAKKLDPMEREAEIERIKARVVYEPPGPEQANPENIKRAMSTLLREKHNDVPEARLELIREWILEARELIEQAAMQGQANAIGVGPSGTPGPAGEPGAPGQMPPQGV